LGWLPGRCLRLHRLHGLRRLDRPCRSVRSVRSVGQHGARVLDAECTDFANAPEIIIRDDGTTTDLGYPWSVQLDARRILVTYYFKAAGEIQHIAGTILRLD
jgi:hypothetical protein